MVHNKAIHGNRIVYLDILKAVAIAMVCTYHLSLLDAQLAWVNPPSTSLELQRFVWGMLSPCVPLFFTVTGTLVLSSERAVRFDRHGRKLARLFVQFLIWQALTMLVIAAWQGVDLRAEGIGTLISALFFNTRGVDVSLHHLWFIPVYIAVALILPLFKPLYAKGEESSSARQYGMILLGLLIATFFVFPDLQRLAHYLGHRSIVLVKTQAFAPFAGMTGVMFAYALLGGYLSQNAERFKTTPRIVWIVLFAVGALLLLIRWNCACCLSGKSWDSVYEGYATTGTLLMTASLYLLASRIDNASIVRRHPLLVRATQIASENSLTVYYLHWILIYTVWQPIMTLLLPLGPVLLWFFSMLKGLALVAVCAALGVALRKIPGIRFLFRQ